MTVTDTLVGKPEFQRVFYLLIGTCLSGPRVHKKVRSQHTYAEMQIVYGARDISSIYFISMQTAPLHTLFASSENRSQSKGGSSGCKFTICEEM